MKSGAHRFNGSAAALPVAGAEVRSGLLISFALLLWLSIIALLLLLGLISGLRITH
jgi:hypothetical protein